MNDEHTKTENKIKETAFNLNDLPIADFEAFKNYYATLTREEIVEKIRTGKLGVADSQDFD